MHNRRVNQSYSRYTCLKANKSFLKKEINNSNYPTFMNSPRITDQCGQIQKKKKVFARKLIHSQSFQGLNIKRSDYMYF